MKINITPVPAPRMSRYDRWTDVEKGKGRSVVLRYFQYRDDLKTAWGDVDLPAQLRLDFVLPMPKSWSNKKRLLMNGTPHQQKPDRDNLEKAVQDALAKDDSYIWHGITTKRWGTEGSVTIEAIE
jgi:Holliday junction resolvase RusA-like endonuclease